MTSSISNKTPPFSMTSLEHAEWLVDIDRPLGDKAKPYIITNECNCANILEFLKMNLPHNPNSHRIHIGFSGWYNFDLIAATNSNFALIGDISEPTKELYIETQKTIAVAKNRFDFMEKVIGLFEREPHKFYRTSMCSIDAQSSAIKAELDNPKSWLGNDESFEKIQRMWNEGRVEFIRLDIQDVASFEKISKWIKHNKLELASLYVSNIGDQLAPGGPEQIEEMQNSISRVIQDNTFVIDATTVDDGSQTTEPQTVFIGKIYRSSLIREDKIPKRSIEELLRALEEENEIFTNEEEKPV